VPVVCLAEEGSIEACAFWFGKFSRMEANKLLKREEHKKGKQFFIETFNLLLF
jgi:hypothetical protein